MLRIMLDSDEPSALPAGVAQLLAVYSDQIKTTDVLRQFRDAHPGSDVVLIDRGWGDPTGLASIADVETGALRPADLPGWFDRKAAARVLFLTDYCNRSNLAACDTALAGRPHWRWVSTLDGTLAIPGFPHALHEPAAVQVIGAAKLGIHADLSIVNNPDWHPSAAAGQAASIENVLTDVLAGARTLKALLT